LTGEGNGRVNILLIGKPGTGRPDEGGPDATDSLMIVSLDTINKGLGLLSIPRDFPVDTDFGSTKINAIYVEAKLRAFNENPDDNDAAEMAGLNKLTEVVEEYMGIPINYYGMMDFTVLEEAVNTLGGITITLEEDYYDGVMIIGGQPLYLEAGLHELDGGMALAYARSRHGLYGSAANSDLSRGQNQQAVLLAIKDKAISIGTFANPMKISGLLDAFGDRVRTNLSIDDMMKVYNFIKDVSPENIKNYTLSDEGEEVVNGSAAPIDGYDEVRAFVREKLKDGFITKENPSIIVLNGTAEYGLAQQKADELTSYGYNVIQVADAPVSVTSTQVIDKTNRQKPYTVRYMELRYNTEAVANVEGLPLDTYQADFIIVVGP
jgi:LCP family protein required for cell wall assembly